MINIISELKEKVTILDLCIQLGIKLSANNMAKCPFGSHVDKTASFKVYPNSNSFYCFGCGKGGDIITLERLFYNLTSNLEAAKKISDDHNLEIFNKESISKRKKEIQNKINKFYQDKKLIDWFDDWIKHVRLDIANVVTCLRFWQESLSFDSSCVTAVQCYKIATKYLPIIQNLREILILGNFENICNNFNVINYYVYEKFKYFLSYERS